MRGCERGCSACRAWVVIVSATIALGSIAATAKDWHERKQSREVPAGDGAGLSTTGESYETDKSADVWSAGATRAPQTSRDSWTAAAPALRSGDLKGRAFVSLTLSPNGTLNVTEGEGRDLHCRIYNKPTTAQVQWYYIKRRPLGYGFSNYTVIANQHLTINFEKFRISYTEPGVYTLSIKHFDIGDDGQYTCLLYVGFSQSYRDSVRINVASKTPVTRPPTAETTPQSPSETPAAAAEAIAVVSATTPAAHTASRQQPTAAASSRSGLTAIATSAVAAESRSGPTAAPNSAPSATGRTRPPEGGAGSAAFTPAERRLVYSTVESGKERSAIETSKASTHRHGEAGTSATPEQPQDGEEVEPAHVLPDVETQPWSRGGSGGAVSPKASTTRCDYQLVINEVDANSCPTLSRSYANSFNDIYQADAPYRETAGVSVLSEKVDKLEDRLIEEMVKHQLVNHSVSEHEQALRHAERTMADQARNISSLDGSLQRVEATVERQRVASRHLDEKLASVMLNVAEMSARLDKAMRRMHAAKADDKRVDVLAASEAAGCESSKTIPYFKDCEDAFQKGNKVSDVYYIKFIYSACPVPVWCDMDTYPGGWLVIQRRRGGAQRFNLNWSDYRKGFGNVSHDFWLGNDNIFLLTNQAEYMLRIDLWDFYDSRVFAEYRRFKVDGERDSFRLHIGNYSGTAKDSFQKHDGIKFSTPDRDHDQWPDYHCAHEWEAGWWFTNCWHAFLNGHYSNATTTKFKGMAWIDWKDEQLARTEMKVRPTFHVTAPAQG